MKKVFFCGFLFFCPFLFVMAQPSQAEIDKMLKQSQDIIKKYGKDSTVNKAMKGAQDQQKQIADAMKNQPANNNWAASSYTPDPGDYGNVDNIGIGLKLELEAKLGPVKAGAGVSAGETMFISFDGNNKFSDGGLKFDAKASAGVEASAGNTVKVKTDIAKTGIEMGYTMGINSGWNFTPGPFK